jgi:hypothetical protein
MRSTLLLPIIAALVIAKISSADSFQFVDSHTGAFASYSRVEIDNTPSGFTDMYGRINLSRPPGPYTCTISFFGRVFHVQLNVTGDANLKRVVLSQ